jgi:hypothetical protein
MSRVMQLGRTGIGGQADLQGRPDVRLRIQRPERAAAVPAAGQLPLRRRPPVGAAVPLRPAPPRLDRHGSRGTLTTEQQTLAASMRHYWANFAARGNPAAKDEPRWPRFNRDSQRMLSLIPPQPQPQTGFAADHHCRFWAHVG